MKVFVLSSSLVLLSVLGTVLSEPPKGDAPAAAGGPYPPSGWKPSGRAFLLPVRGAPRDSYNVPPPAPKPSYGPPPPPSSSYGPPSTTEAPTTEAPTTTEQVTESVTEPVTEQPEYEDDTASDVDAPRGDGGNGGPSAFASANAFANADARAFARARAEADAGDAGASGLYFVLLPDGRLQRVAYTTSRDQRVFQRLVAEPAPQNSGFLAIQYQDVSPIQAPVYTYGSDNALLRIY